MLLKWRFAWILALALLAGPAFALGLGQIQVRSQYGEPLLAEIQIVSSDPAELRQLQARLASPETFARIGLQPPQGLVQDLQFNVALDATGRPVIRATSPEPVEQPLLTFLIEADWGQGRLVREYSALVDAPDTIAAPAQPPIQAPEVDTGDRIVRPAPAPLAQEAPVGEQDPATGPGSAEDAPRQVAGAVEEESAASGPEPAPAPVAPAPAPVAAAAARRNPRSNPALCATSTDSRENSRNVDITSPRAGASTRSVGVIPVSRLTCAGRTPSIETNVDISARSSPPWMRTAPISVISSLDARVPVVSRSTTTKVVSDSSGSSSSNDA